MPHRPADPTREAARQALALGVGGSKAQTDPCPFSLPGRTHVRPDPAASVEGPRGTPQGGRTPAYARPVRPRPPPLREVLPAPGRPAFGLLQEPHHREDPRPAARPGPGGRRPRL